MLEESMINGFSRLSPPAVINTKTTMQKIEFSCSNGFQDLLTNPLKTDNGQTVGERNRAWLHEKLDAWLDRTFEENT